MKILGDCINELDKLESGSIDLILIDPPYIISKDSNFKNYSEEASSEIITKYGKLSIDFGEWDKVELNWSDLFKQFQRLLRPGGTLIVFYDIWKCNELKESALLYKFKQPRVCCWTKSNPVPVNSKLNYLSNANEYFFTFIKGSKPTFNSEYDNGLYKYPICHGKERYNHPTQKPLSLIKELVEKHSKVGDTVLDCFAGTGTTGHASVLLDRKFILIEKDTGYFEIMKERIEQLVINKI